MRSVCTAATSKRSTKPRMFAKYPCVVVQALSLNCLRDSFAARCSVRVLPSMNSGAMIEMPIHFSFVTLNRAFSHKARFQDRDFDSLWTGTDKCCTLQVHIKRTEKQLQMISMVPRTCGEDTKVTLSNGMVQFGSTAVKALAEVTNNKIADRGSNAAIMALGAARYQGILAAST